MCSCARMGLPAATRPTKGNTSWARLCKGRENCLMRDSRTSLMERRVSLRKRMPREVPLTSSIGIGRAKTQLAGDFGPGRWRTSKGNGVLNQLQNLLLAGCELGLLLAWVGEMIQSTHGVNSLGSLVCCWQRCQAGVICRGCMTTLF